VKAFFPLEPWLQREASNYARVAAKASASGTTS